MSNIGSKVANLAVGDAVFGAAPGNFGNFVRVLGASVQKMASKDKFEEVTSMPVAFMTAIYAFNHLARLEKGETVLIQSATGGLGMAAMQLAKHIGAEIYATVGNADKIEVLKKEFGIAEDHIFNSRELSTPSKILAATNGAGIDVVLCSAAGEAMQESWRAIAPMGRFIEVGRTDVLDHGKLNMEVFKRNATFSSFDLGLMNQQKPAKVASLMAELADLHRKGIIKPFSHIKTFDVSQLEQAMMHFAKGTHLGKVVVTFQNPTAVLKVRPTPKQVSFDPNAAYLLAGCLGGLGRSISIRMAEHGAKHLVYFSRSGSTNAEASELLYDLSVMGVATSVIKCDITSKSAVCSAVCKIRRPIKRRYPSRHGCQRRHLRHHDPLPIQIRHRPQSRRHHQPPRSHPRPTPRLLQYDLLHRHHDRHRHPRELLRRQRLPRQLRALPRLAGPARPILCPRHDPRSRLRQPPPRSPEIAHAQRRLRHRAARIPQTARSLFRAANARSEMVVRRARHVAPPHGARTGETGAAVP